MNDVNQAQQELIKNGFSIIEGIYSEFEVQEILHQINQTDQTNTTFRKSAELFAIRQFLKEVPQTTELIFNTKLNQLINEVIGNNFFIVKSIYFDKPVESNWYVAYHQDLTISVDKKLDMEHFNCWTSKHNQFAVQPPVHILENITTMRIHLDDTDEYNGALRVVPESHLKGICRPETIDWDTEKETSCCVKQGGVMLMKPLILHSSSRTTNKKRRRVIHIELSNIELPQELAWAERINFQ